MTPAVPAWLTAASIIWLAAALASALYMFVAVFRRPMMPIMRAVWPINALYLGPFAVWAFHSVAHDHVHVTTERMWKSVLKATLHCGAGCTLGDVVAETTVFLLGIEVVGRAIWAEYPADYALAFLFGIGFQYFTIAPMRGLGVRDGIVAALKADTLALTAFEIGLFGWMAVMAFVLFQPPLRPDRVEYLGLMQLGMALGFLTSYPMNWWLVRHGLKERM